MVGGCFDQGGEQILLIWDRIGTGTWARANVRWSEPLSESAGAERGGCVGWVCLAACLPTFVVVSVYSHTNGVRARVSRAFMMRRPTLQSVSSVNGDGGRPAP